MKTKKVMNSTTNSRIYKLSKRLYLDHFGLCSWCPPHGGCNWSRNNLQRSWKEHRKTQYRER